MRSTRLAAALLVLSLGVAAQDADLVETASRAMGASGLRSLEYSAAGSIFLLGQAASPGGPWPRFTLTRYAVAVDYVAPAMREELVRVDDERPPRGGGAGPFNPATGQGGIRPIPGAISQVQVRDGRTEIGRLQIWMTPHGFLQAAAANKATVTPLSGGRRHAVSFVAPGKYVMTATLDEQNLVEAIETRIPNAVLGDMPVEWRFSNYRAVGGVQVPGRIVQRQGGHPILDLTVGEARPNGGVTIASGGTPRGAAGAAPPAAPVTPVQTADGVWFMGGGAPNSFLVEFSDHVVVVEAPQNDQYTMAVIAAAGMVAPGKPIRYVVNTHHHFDHAGGLRAYVAEGVTILTHRLQRPYYERILRNSFQLGPDRLARSPRAPAIEEVGDKRVLTDGRRTLELHLVRGNLHSEGLLMAYLPAERLLLQADAFHPRPGAPPLPAPSPFTVNLLENVERLRLDVARVAHIHGGVDSLAALRTAAGRTER